MKPKPTDDFERCIERKLMKDGRVEVHCKRGLWLVSAPDRETADREARHYWQQYHADGEYADLLNL